jgi:hypothetical protein
MFSTLAPKIGNQPISFSGLTVNTTPVELPGTIVPALDNWWGAGEFIYVRAAGAIPMFNLITITPVFDSTLKSYRYDAVVAPNTANLGRMLAVAVKTMASGDYGWAQISGLTPVSCGASVAADTAFGITAAGQGGAIANGKQILNARVMVAAAATVAKANCQSIGGLSTTLQVPDSDGWFVGAYLSGTGVAAATIVSSIDPSGRFVTMNNAATAVINGTVTATYNNATIYYNVAHLNRPFAQGQVT